jgi:hypothetical protein
MRQTVNVKNSPDPELYRYGIHWADFTINLTVGPGVYHVRLKFAETQFDGPGKRGITIYMNGTPVVTGLDVWATAGGGSKPVDLVFNDVHPQNGVIAVRLEGVALHGCIGEAMLQALEVAPGDGGKGTILKTIDLPHDRGTGSLLHSPPLPDGQ